MPGEFSILRRVQFAETDMAGVAHFASYFRWMEEVEHAFFRSVGLSVVMTQDGKEIGWPRVAAACEYSAPARFEDELELRLRVTKVGNKSFNYEVDVLKGGQRIALGKLTSICCAVSAGGGFTPVEIPPEIRQKLAGQA
jgi:YbgC/YbaW family acyl-CoA thioester hydrolase